MYYDVYIYDNDGKIWTIYVGFHDKTSTALDMAAKLGFDNGILGVKEYQKDPKKYRIGDARCGIDN